MKLSQNKGLRVNVTLQQRREKPYQRLEQPLQEWTLDEVGDIIYQDRFRLVSHVDVLDAQCHGLSVEESICLEIILETTEIDVCASARAQVVVAYQQLAMVESVLVKIDFHASLYRLHQERPGSQFHEPSIPMARYD